MVFPLGPCYLTWKKAVEKQAELSSGLPNKHCLILHFSSLCASCKCPHDPACWPPQTQRFKTKGTHGQDSPPPGQPGSGIHKHEPIGIIPLNLFILIKLQI